MILNFLWKLHRQHRGNWTAQISHTFPFFLNWIYCVLDNISLRHPRSFSAKNPIKFSLLPWKQGSLKHTASLTTRDKSKTYFGSRPKVVKKKRKSRLWVCGGNSGRYCSFFPVGLSYSTTEILRNRAEPAELDLSPGSNITGSFFESTHRGEHRE